MGYRSETKIQREEDYVNSHAASVDRTINSREFRLGTLSYVKTGHIPHDRFWSALARQEQHNPSKFFAHNPQYVGFFTAPAKLGELPQGNVIFDVMKDRDIHQHAIFAAHHPFYVGLVDRDLRLETELTRSLAGPLNSLIASPNFQNLSPITPFVSPILSIGSPILSVGSPILSVGSPIVAVNSPIVAVNSPIVAVNSPITPIEGPTLSIVSTNSGLPGVSTLPVVTTTSTPAPLGSTLHGSGIGFGSESGTVPEPASILMMAIGLIAVLSLRRFTRHS